MREAVTSAEQQKTRVLTFQNSQQTKAIHITYNVNFSRRSEWKTTQ